MVLEKVSRRLERVVSLIGISGAGALPLLVGLTSGLAYGAGIIVKYGKEGKLTRHEMVLIITLLSLNHSLFEDVLLFVAIGAQGTVLQVTRMTVEIVLTATLARFLRPGCEEQKQQQSYMKQPIAEDKFDFRDDDQSWSDPV